MSFRDLLNKTALIELRTGVDDEYGTETVTWTTRHAAVPCRLNPLKWAEVQIYGSERGVNMSKMFVEARWTGIILSDRVTISGVVYGIVAIPDAAGHGHHWEIVLRQIQENV